MLRKFILCVVLAACVSVPLTAHADEMPAGKWWHNPRVVEELGLTQEERGALDQAFLDYQRDSIELKSRVQQKQVEIDHMLSQNRLEEEAAMQLMRDLDHARTELSRRRFQFLLDVRKVLGQDRFNILKLQFRKWRMERSR